MDRKALSFKMKREEPFECISKLVFLILVNLMRRRNLKVELKVGLGELWFIFFSVF